MIALKNIFALISIAIFVIIIIVTFKVSKQDLGNCGYDNHCVRVCSEKGDIDKQIESSSHFLLSDISASLFVYRNFNGKLIEIKGFKIYNGQPECIDQVINTSAIKSFEYSSVRIS